MAAGRPAGVTGVGRQATWRRRSWNKLQSEHSWVRTPLRSNWEFIARQMLLRGLHGYQNVIACGMIRTWKWIWTSMSCCFRMRYLFFFSTALHNAELSENVLSSAPISCTIEGRIDLAIRVMSDTFHAIDFFWCLGFFCCVSVGLGERHQLGWTRATNGPSHMTRFWFYVISPHENSGGTTCGETS